MDDREDSPEEFVHAGDLIQVSLAQLHHLQNVQTEEVGAGKIGTTSDKGHFKIRTTSNNGRTNWTFCV